MRLTLPSKIMLDALHHGNLRPDKIYLLSEDSDLLTHKEYDREEWKKWA